MFILACWMPCLGSCVEKILQPTREIIWCFMHWRLLETHLGGREEASEALPAMVSSCPLIAFWPLGVRPFQAEQKTAWLPFLCLRFPRVHVAGHTWWIVRTCLWRKFAGSEGQIFTGALLPNDHPSVNTSESPWCLWKHFREQQGLLQWRAEKGQDRAMSSRP